MQAYHLGFREQTKKWPRKPFEMIGAIVVKEIREGWEAVSGTSGLSKGSSTTGGKKRSSSGTISKGSKVPPGALIADLGAGEGPLSRYLGSHPDFTSSSLLPLLELSLLLRELLRAN